jgi:hypothetical protein
VAALAYLTAGLLAVGLWAQFAPASFYTDFPGSSLGWVAADGPYNEHLVRDVGGGSLALGIVALVALLRPHPTLVRAVALAALVTQVPHTIYHLLHLDLAPTLADRASQVILLASLLIVPALLLRAVRSPARAHPSAATTHHGSGDRLSPRHHSPQIDTP